MQAELLAAQVGRQVTRYGPLFAFLLLLVAYHTIFSQFFPNRYGRIGHDYSLALPALLAGYYWFKANGFWDVPWFTPAFCGGQPFFADPQSDYYSAGQFLTLVVDPLTASYLTMLLFATLGYWGFYVLLRRGFAVSRPAAVLAAAIFMFNGFVSHRMIVGHVGYSGLMLVPWLACFLVFPSNSKRHAWLHNVTAGWAAGLVGAYWVQAGLGTLLAPAMLSAGVLALLYLFRAAHFHAWQLVWRCSVAGVTMFALSAAKVVAGLSFLSNFPRADYLLPGYESVAAAAEIAFLSLFISPADIAQRSDALLRNVQWAIGRHELEYGVTAVPLLIVAIGAAIGIWRVTTGRSKLILGKAQLGLLALVALILVTPIMLNTYAPDWNAVLKQTPLLKSASTFVRWYLIFIPFFALVSALVLERSFGRVRTSAAIIAVALIVTFNLVQDRRAYAQESYSPDGVVTAYRAIRGGTVSPEIRQIGVYRGSDGSVVFPLERNDGFSRGLSPMHCYNPIFGYALEKFPIKDLHPGPVQDLRDGHFNIKNPACYVYPEENACSPGDHFRETQHEDMEKFVSYRSFGFKISTAQKAANSLTYFAFAANILAILAVAAFGLFNLSTGARRSRTDSRSI